MQFSQNPTVRAACLKRRTQVIWIHAQALSKSQRLVTRHDARPQQEIVARLCDLPSANLPHVENILRVGAEDRMASRDVLWVPTDKYGKRSSFCDSHAERDGRVNQTYAPRRRNFRQFTTRIGMQRT